MRKFSILSFTLFLLAFESVSASAKNGNEGGTDSAGAPVTAAAPAGTQGGGGGPVNSYFIPIDTANKMLQSYLTSVGADADNNMNLQSLILDADALREYLANPSIKKVKVMFAHTLQYINSGHVNQPCGYKSGALTIVVVGVDDGNNYVPAPGGDVVLDRAVPCPSNCGLTGTASDMLIH